MGARTLKDLDGAFRMVDGDGTFGWRMGLQRLRDGWLDVTAPDRGDLLAEKRRILDAHYPQAVVLLDGIEGPSTEILDAVVASLAEAGAPVGSIDGDAHPLVAAALLTVEDLVVMVERDGRLVFGGGVVCFPNRWDLPSKVGKTMAEVHAPVPRLNEQAGARIDGFLSSLRVGQVFGRRGWGVIDTPDLFQPVNPAGKTVADADPGDLFLRVEDETLQRFTSHNVVLFTIRTRLHRLTDVLADPVLAAEFRAVAAVLPDDVADYKNMGGITGVLPAR